MFFGTKKAVSKEFNIVKGLMEHLRCSTTSMFNTT
jgi:hypothetical protein